MPVNSRRADPRPPLDGVGLVDGSTLPSGDRGFESISLHRRVYCEPDLGLGGRDHGAAELQSREGGRIRAVRQDDVFRPNHLLPSLVRTVHVLASETDPSSPDIA